MKKRIQEMLAEDERAMKLADTRLADAIGRGESTQCIAEIRAQRDYWVGRTTAERAALTIINEETTALANQFSRALLEG